MIRPLPGWRPALAGLLLLAAVASPAAETPTPAFRYLRVDRTVAPPVVSLDVKRAPGRAVLSELARLRGLSIVFHGAPGEVEITARLERLTWDEVLRSTLRTAGWEHRLEGRVLEIAPLGWFDLGPGG